MNKLLINSILYAIILNVVVSFAFDFIATEKEKIPKNGVDKLTFKEQVVHMFVHHKQVIFASSIIVAAVVALSISFAQKIPILK
tara:strand:- start:1115 stop:1366 length:252 start_codon:yes stop_codon:yes gene_type:complete